MIIDEFLDFAKEVPPFQFLEEEVLRTLAIGISLKFYPQGTMILQQGGPAAGHLMLIKKGGVKVFAGSSEEDQVVIDYRSEGDVFGFLSLVSGDKSRLNIVAVEDTITYLIDRGKVIGLLDETPAFTEFFVKSFLTRFIDKTFTEMHNRSLLSGGGDKLLFTTPVGELATKAAVTAPHDITIHQAAEIMSEKNISSLVLVDGDGVPRGLVTDRDLREKVVARGRSIDEEISTIMSVTLIKIESRDYCFEALLKMIRYNIHHLLVVEEGRLKGVVTNHDLMILQGTSPLSLARDIESQQTLEEIIPAARKIHGMITLLLKEGARASNITRIVTEINDRLVARIIRIAERTLGRPPLNYCWIVFGSEGRKEQTFMTDQDNALIWAKPGDDTEAQRAREYFGRFTAFVNDALVSCGFPLCTGGYMAKTEKWRQPLSQWKEYFSRWINTPTAEAILQSVILFDFRPVAGDFVLADELKTHLLSASRDAGIFLREMAGLAVRVRPPLGFFRQFVVEKSGEHKNLLNLKYRCIAPLVNIVRLFSLEEGLHETATLERIDALAERRHWVAEHADELRHAFEYFSLLRIHHQYGQIEKGIEPDNFIDPEKLTNLEKRTMKESCQIISRIQDSIAKRYNPGTVM